VLQDELGDGEVVLNHCTLYTTLMNSVGIYPNDVHTREYAYDDQLLDSAFSAPVYQLSVGLFPDFFYPELLGTTLQIEWTVIESKMTALLFEHFGLDPHYYTLHVGIDNASSGHGHMAFQAVELFMEKIRKEGGDVQGTFRRIWRGYVAFQTVGTLGADMANMFAEQYPDDGNLAPYYKSEMIKMIKRKAEYGSKNHDNHKLGDSYINDLFSDPEGFLAALPTKKMENGKHVIVPGDLDNSQIFWLISFDGPMSHAFTRDEIELWKNYIVSLKPKADKKVALARLKNSAAIPVHSRAQFQALRAAKQAAAGLVGARAAEHGQEKAATVNPAHKLLWLNSSREERARSLTGVILGRGTVH